jgi:hypothetical protein
MHLAEAGGAELGGLAHLGVADGALGGEEEVEEGAEHEGRKPSFLKKRSKKLFLFRRVVAHCVGSNR